MNKVAIQVIAGVTVADSNVVTQAIEYAREHCEPYLFNHSVRTWLFSTRLGQIQGIEHDNEVVAFGTLLHDITLNKRFAGPRRFEVEAADIARTLAKDAGFDARRTQLIWDSVAMNTTASIAMFKEPEVALCTGGIGLDVIGSLYDVIPAQEIANILQAFPRLGIKQKMTECFCHIAETCPETTYDNFCRDFGERFVKGYAAPSVVNMLRDAPFDE